jgi:hypothetical protein
VHGIGGSGEYCNDNDAHLDCIDVIYLVTTIETYVGAAA